MHILSAGVAKLILAEMNVTRISTPAKDLSKSYINNLLDSKNIIGGNRNVYSSMFHFNYFDI